MEGEKDFGDIPCNNCGVKHSEHKDMKKMLYQIYDDIDFDENDSNEFRRFVEKLKGIKPSGIVFGGVEF